MDWPSPITSRFPISDIRPTKHTLILSQSTSTFPKSCYNSSYSTSRHMSRTFEIAQGILSNGTLTPNCPDVRAYLDAAHKHPTAPPLPPTSPPIFALAALATFYSPTHPAHWVFWNREERRNTAEVVQMVLYTNPCPIASPVGWIGIQENLWILTSVQHAYRPLLASLPWHAALEPASPVQRMSLRKRKPVVNATEPVACGEREDTPSETDSQHPRKRQRTTRPRPQMVLLAAVAAEQNLEDAVVAGKIGAVVGSAAGKENKKEEDVQPFTDLLLPPTVVGPVKTDAKTEEENEEDTPPVRTSLRQRERRAAAASASASSPSSSSTLVSPGPDREDREDSDAESDLSALTAVDGEGESAADAGADLEEGKGKKDSDDNGKSGEGEEELNEEEEEPTPRPPRKRARASGGRNRRRARRW